MNRVRITTGELSADKEWCSVNGRWFKVAGLLPSQTAAFTWMESGDVAVSTAHGWAILKGPTE